MPKHNRDGLQTGLQSLRDHALIDEEPPRGEGEGIAAMWLADATVHKRRRGYAKREVLDLLAQSLWNFDRFKLSGRIPAPPRRICLWPLAVKRYPDRGNGSGGRFL